MLQKQKNINIQKIQNKSYNELISIFKYEGIIRYLILNYKFKEKAYISKTFVQFILKNKKIFDKIKMYDKIIPVPVSKNRYKQRGYNQSELLSKEISKQTGIEYVNDVLIKNKDIIEQSKLNKEQRSKNIKNAYNIKDIKKVENKKILLIDDIYTTGSTVEECCKTLRQSNVQNIGVMVLAKD